MGFVGKDPQEKIMNSGSKLVYFSLAVEFYSKGEKKTEWFNIQVWDEGLHKMVSHIRKGNCVIVCGDSLASSTFVNRDGETKVSNGIKAASIAFTPMKKSEEKKPEESESLFDRKEENEKSHIF